MPVSPPAPARVAPTAKIPDDAPIAPPTRPGPMSGQHPNVSYAPPAMPTPPPGSLQQASIPQTSQRRPQLYDGPAPQPRALSRAPIDSGSSFAAPMHTPLGLIAVVLLVDLALAGTGAFLLAKGLSKPETAATKGAPPPAAAPPQKSEAAPAPAAPADPPTTPTLPAAPPAAPQEATAPPAPPEPATPAPAKPATGPASARRPAAPATPPSKSVSTETEIATKVMGSRTAFGHCREQAGEVHGNIDIAFRVLGDGGVGNVSIVEDTTGSPTLAACLRDTIATWKVTPHNGAPLSFVRPFTYP